MRILLILMISASTLLAQVVHQYKVHYSLNGAGHDITVNAETSSEARYTVMAMIPEATVTGARRVK
jgi:hypothetical protein